MVIFPHFFPSNLQHHQSVGVTFSSSENKGPSLTHSLFEDKGLLNENVTQAGSIAAAAQEAEDLCARTCELVWNRKRQTKDSSD